MRPCDWGRRHGWSPPVPLKLPVRALDKPPWGGGQGTMGWPGTAARGKPGAGAGITQEVPPSWGACQSCTLGPVPACPCVSFSCLHRMAVCAHRAGCFVERRLPGSWRLWMGVRTEGPTPESPSGMSATVQHQLSPIAPTGCPLKSPDVFTVASVGIVAWDGELATEGLNALWCHPGPPRHACPHSSGQPTPIHPRLPTSQAPTSCPRL